MIRRTCFLVLLAAGFALILACKPGSAPPASSAGKDDAATVARKTERLERLMASRSEAATALDALAAVLPDRVWLTEVAYEPGKVRVKGRAPSNNLLADYITRLGQSPAFTGLTLGGSVMRNVGGRESQEFGLEIALFEPAAERASSGPGADASARLQELEKKLPARGEPAGMLREIQSLALDEGLQMTRFAPGAEAAGDLAAELPVMIEVVGDRRPVGRYLRGLADSPSFWTIDRLGWKAISPDDPRSQVRATIGARAHFAR